METLQLVTQDQKGSDRTTGLALSQHTWDSATFLNRVEGQFKGCPEIQREIRKIHRLAFLWCTVEQSNFSGQQQAVKVQKRQQEIKNLFDKIQVVAVCGIVGYIVVMAVAFARHASWVASLEKLPVEKIRDVFGPKVAVWLRQLNLVQVLTIFVPVIAVAWGLEKLRARQLANANGSDARQRLAQTLKGLLAAEVFNTLGLKEGINDLKQKKLGLEESQADLLKEVIEFYSYREKVLSRLMRAVTDVKRFYREQKSTQIGSALGQLTHHHEWAQDQQKAILEGVSKMIEEIQLLTLNKVKISEDDIADICNKQKNNQVLVQHIGLEAKVKEIVQDLQRDIADERFLTTEDVNRFRRQVEEKCRLELPASGSIREAITKAIKEMHPDKNHQSDGLDADTMSKIRNLFSQEDAANMEAVETSPLGLVKCSPTAIRNLKARVGQLGLSFDISLFADGMGGEYAVKQRQAV